MNTPQLIPLPKIKYEKDLQIRVCVCDGDHIDAIKEAILTKTELPPIEVFQDLDGYYYIGDGNHRYLAYFNLNKKEIPCLVFPGGREAAFQRALGANSEHNALRRTNKDKRNAVKLAIQAYPKMSARAIADLCKVHHQMVGIIRKELQVDDSSTSVTGKDGKEYPAKPTFPSQRGEQLDFFDVINRNFNTAYESIQTTLKDPVWGNLEITIDDKLKAISEIKRNLKEIVEELQRYEADFRTAKSKDKEA